MISFHASVVLNYKIWVTSQRDGLAPNRKVSLPVISAASASPQAEDAVCHKLLQRPLPKSEKKVN